MACITSSWLCDTFIVATVGSLLAGAGRKFAVTLMLEVNDKTRCKKKKSVLREREREREHHKHSQNDILITSS